MSDIADLGESCRYVVIVLFHLISGPNPHEKQGCIPHVCLLLKILKWQGFDTCYGYDKEDNIIRKMWLK